MSAGRVGLKRSKRIALASVWRERLRNGELLADIIEDGGCEPPLFFGIVQKQGSPEILFLEQFRSRSEATEAAVQFMSEHLERKSVA